MMGIIKPELIKKENLPLQDQILALIHERPGISGADIHKHFWPRNLNTIVSILDRFQRSGLIENKGEDEERLSQWYPILVGEILPEFLEFAHVLLGELNSLTVSGREVYLAKRIQEEFQKNSVVQKIGEYPDIDEIAADQNTWAELQRVRNEIRRNAEIREEATLLFGYTTVLDWSIDDCKSKLSEIYDRWWHKSGGTGSHPMSPK